MEAKIRLGYFLEDVGQEAFLISLVSRIAGESGIVPAVLVHDPRSVVGGLGKAISELRRFLLDVRRGHVSPYDILIVAIDGNCQGYAAKRDEIRRVAEQAGYRGAIVCAVPDPHIERWYLVDVDSLRRVLETDVQPDVPANKCERGRYKAALRAVFRQARLIAPLGGAEYGSEIAASLNLYAVGKHDPGFKHFVDDLTAALSALARMGQQVPIP